MFFNEHVDVNYCLSKAAQRGYLEIVQMLVNDTDPCFNDCEALRLAAENGYTEIVDILLNNGSDVHAKDNYALKYSAINGHEETVELLLNFGASPSQEMIDNVTNDNIKYLLTNMSNTKMLKFAGKMN